MTGGRQWKVLGHGPIDRLDERVWHVEAELPGVPLGRRMVIFKRSDGGLVIHNGVALEERAMQDIEAWGEPRYLVVPNPYHRIDAARYKARYPEIQVVCPAPSRRAVEKVVPVDRSYDELGDDPYVRVETLAGSKVGEGVFIASEASGGTTLTFNDTLFNVQGPVPGLKGLLVRAVGATGGPKVTPLIRMLLVSDRAALAEHLRRLAAIPTLHRVIPGHGAIVTKDPKGALERVADAL